MPSYSQRIRDLIINQPALLRRENEQKLSTRRHFRLESPCLLVGVLDSSGKLEGLYHGPYEERPLGLAAIEALATLLRNQDILRLQSVSWREVESYLRDSNLGPAFSTQDLSAEWLESLLLALYQSWLVALVSPPELSGKAEFEAVALVLRLKAVNELFENKLKPAWQAHGIQIELVDLENERVIVELTGVSEAFLPAIKSAIHQLTREHTSLELLVVLEGEDTF